MLPSLKTEADFATAASGQQKLVIDAYSTWCGPCKMMAPLFEALSTKFPAIGFYKMDTDAAEELTVRFSVTALPTFIFIKDGQILNTVIGANQKALENYLTIFASL
jgi:thioredoxin 1